MRTKRTAAVGAMTSAALTPSLERRAERSLGQARRRHAHNSIRGGGGRRSGGSESARAMRQPCRGGVSAGGPELGWVAASVADYVRAEPAGAVRAGGGAKARTIFLPLAEVAKLRFMPAVAFTARDASSWALPSSLGVSSSSIAASTSERGAVSGASSAASSAALWGQGRERRAEQRSGCVARARVRGRRRVPAREPCRALRMHAGLRAHLAIQRWSVEVLGGSRVHTGLGVHRGGHREGVTERKSEGTIGE